MTPASAKPHKKRRQAEDIEDQDVNPTEDDILIIEEENEEVTPSWFVKTYPGQSVDSLASQYRTTQPDAASTTPEVMDEAYALYRRRLEERFQQAQRMADPDFAPQVHLHEHEPPPRVRQHEPSPRAQRQAPNPFTPRPEFQAPRPRARSSTSVLGVSMPMAIMLTALACGFGSAAGYFLANPKALTSLSGVTIAGLGGWFGSDEPTNVAAVVAKPVKTAEVTVQDVAGSVNAPIPLEISALAPDARTPITLKISGLPQDSYLTTGTQLKNGEWVLRPEELNAAQLVVPKSEAAELGLLVTALDAQTGVEAAPAKKMRVALDLNAVPTPGLQPPPDPSAQSKQLVTVTPVSAQPNQGVAKGAELPQAVPPPLEILKEEAGSFLEKGDMLLKAGDIIAARQFYLRAFELESPDGAYGVARTYDPKVYAELKVRGLTPNQEKALEWYGKAAAGGHAEASQELLAPPQ